MSRTVRFTFNTISYNLDNEFSSVDGHPIMTIPFVAEIDGSSANGIARIKTSMPEDTRVEALRLVDAPAMHVAELEAAVRDYFAMSIPRYLYPSGLGVINVGTIPRSDTYTRKATAIFEHTEAGLEFQRWQ